jgi:hypothetical protein
MLVGTPIIGINNQTKLLNSFLSKKCIMINCVKHANMMSVPHKRK